MLNHARGSELRLTILEARNACSGATGRNGGHLVSDVCERFEDLVRALGVDEAVKILRFSEANIVELKEVVARLDASEQDAVELREVIATSCIGDTETLDHLRRSMKLLESTIGKATALQHDLVEDPDIIKVSY